MHIVISDLYFFFNKPLISSWFFRHCCKLGSEKRKPLKLPPWGLISHNDLLVTFLLQKRQKQFRKRIYSFPVPFLHSKQIPFHLFTIFKDTSWIFSRVSTQGDSNAIFAIFSFLLLVSAYFVYFKIFFYNIFLHGEDEELEDEANQMIFIWNRSRLWSGGNPLPVNTMKACHSD